MDVGWTAKIGDRNRTSKGLAANVIWDKFYSGFSGKDGT